MDTSVDVKVKDNSVDEEHKLGFELSTEFTSSDNIHNMWDYAPIDNINLNDQEFKHFAVKGKPQQLTLHHQDTNRYIRYGDITGKPIYNTWLRDMDENLGVDETVDVDKGMRCMAYMSSFKCHKGDYCNKIHRFPKEDGVVCWDNKYEKCLRSTSDCWFSHTGKKVKAPLPENDAPYLVQPMGHLVAYLRSSNFTQGRVVKQQQQLDHRDPQSYHYKLQRWLQDQMNLEYRDHQNSFHLFMKVIEKDIETQKRRYNPNIWQPHV